MVGKKRTIRKNTKDKREETGGGVKEKRSSQELTSA